MNNKDLMEKYRYLTIYDPVKTYDITKEGQELLNQLLKDFDPGKKKREERSRKIKEILKQ